MSWIDKDLLAEADGLDLSAEAGRVIRRTREALQPAVDAVTETAGSVLGRLTAAWQDDEEPQPSQPASGLTAPYEDPYAAVANPANTISAQTPVGPASGTPVAMPAAPRPQLSTGEMLGQVTVEDGRTTPRYSLGALDYSSPQALRQSLRDSAQVLADKYDLPPEIVAAIPIQEAGFVGSRLSKEGHNLFSIKGQGPAGSMVFTEGAAPEDLNTPFKRYNSPAESFEDFARLITTEPRYAKAVQVWRETRNPARFLEEVQKAGYATDWGDADGTGVPWWQKVVNISKSLPGPSAGAAQRQAAPAPAPAPAATTRRSGGVRVVPDAQPNSYWTSSGTHGGSPAADIFAPIGSPILAPVGGTIEPGTYPKGGHAATMRGDDGRHYYFAHGNVPFRGGRVEAGQQIGQVGDSGNAKGTSPHLHYAIASNPSIFDQRDGSGDIEGEAYWRTPDGQVHSTDDGHNHGAPAPAVAAEPQQPTGPVPMRQLEGAAPQAEQQKQPKTLLDRLTALWAGDDTDPPDEAAVYKDLGGDEEYDPRDADSGPREATPGSTGAMPLTPPGSPYDEQAQQAEPRPDRFEDDDQPTVTERLVEAGRSAVGSLVDPDRPRRIVEEAASRLGLEWRPRTRAPLEERIGEQTGEVVPDLPYGEALANARDRGFTNAGASIIDGAAEASRMLGLPSAAEAFEEWADDMLTRQDPRTRRRRTQDALSGPFGVVESAVESLPSVAPTVLGALLAAGGVLSGNAGLAAAGTGVARAGLAAGGLSAFGSQARELRREVSAGRMSQGMADAVALGAGLVEVATERLFPGADSKLVRGMGTEVAQKWLADLRAKGLVGAAKNVLKEAGQEGVEEMVAESYGVAVDSVFKEKKPTLEQAARRIAAAGVTGAAIGGGIAAGTQAVEAAADRQARSRIARDVEGTRAQGRRAAGALLESLVERGVVDRDYLKEHPPTVDRVLGLLSIAAEGKADDEVISVPGLAPALIKLDREVIGDSMDEWVDGKTTAGQVRAVLRAPKLAERAWAGTQEIVADLLSGTNNRQRRRRETAADTATVRGLPQALRDAAHELADVPHDAEEDSIVTPYGRARKTEDPDVLSFVDGVAESMGLPQSMSVFLTGSSEPFAAAGVREGGEQAVVLSAGLADVGLTEDELRAVLGHELAHIGQQSADRVKQERRGSLVNRVRRAIARSKPSGPPARFSNVRQAGQQRLTVREMSGAGTQRDAFDYVDQVHRHNAAPQGDKSRWEVVGEDGQRHGIATAGRPNSRRLDDGVTLEVTRVATDGTPNAVSALYGAVRRAAPKMDARTKAQRRAGDPERGYQRMVTFTLASEPGTSLRAAGWTPVAVTKDEAWTRPSRARGDVAPSGQKIRWEIDLTGKKPPVASEEALAILGRNRPARAEMRLERAIGDETGGAPLPGMPVRAAPKRERIDRNMADSEVAPLYSAAVDDADVADRAIEIARRFGAEEEIAPLAKALRTAKGPMERGVARREVLAALEEKAVSFPDTSDDTVIADYISERPRTLEDIAKAFAIKPTTVRQALERIQEDGQRIQSVGHPGVGQKYFIDNAADETPGASAGESSEQPKYDYSSTQLDLPKKLADQVRRYSKNAIADADLHENGREDEPHVTVKYGLTTADPEDVRRIVEASPPITVRLGKVSTFEKAGGGKFDVVKVDVDSPELRALNAELSKLPNEDEHPTYQPHLTLAYVKPGKGRKYKGSRKFEGQTVTIDRLTFSGKNGERVEIPLKGEAATTSAKTPRRKLTDYEERIARTAAHVGARQGRTGLTAEAWGNEADISRQDAQRAIRGLVEAGVMSATGGEGLATRYRYDGAQQEPERRDSPQQVTEASEGQKRVDDLLATLRGELETTGRTSEVNAPPEHELRDAFLEGARKLAREMDADVFEATSIVPSRDGIRRGRTSVYLSLKDPDKIRALRGLPTEKATAPAEQRATVDTEGEGDGSRGRVSGPEQERPGGADRGALADARPRPVSRAEEDRRTGERGAPEGGRDDRGRPEPPGGRADRARSMGGRDARGSAGRPELSPAERLETATAVQDVVMTTDDLTGRTPVQRWDDNLAALRVLMKLRAEGRGATIAEQRILARYSGFGDSAFEHAFKPKSDNAAWKRRGDELRALVPKAEYEAIRESRINANYTSAEVVGAMWGALDRMGLTVPGLRVLDPSAGSGRFFGFMPPSMAQNASRWMVELDTMTGELARALFPQASVQITGFQDARIPDDSFDLAISNVPFSRDVRIGNGQDPSVPKKLGNLALHNYFFFKALRAVRPGGVVAFVTTHQTLDAPTSRAFRRHLATQADFVGAIRLPQDAFVDTSVTTDVVFLKKRAMPSTATETWVETDDQIGEDGTPYALNRYFVQHPEMALGKHSTSEGRGLYRGNEYRLVKDGRDLGQLLRNAVYRLPVDVFEPATPDSFNADLDSVQEAHDSKPGAYVVKAGKLGTRVLKVHDPVTQSLIDPPNMTDAAKARVIRMMDVRDAARSVLARQLDPGASDAAVRQAQATLARHYDGFVREYGPISETYNQGLLRTEPDAPLLRALERRETLVELRKRRISEGRKIATGKQAGQIEPKPWPKLITAADLAELKMPIFTERVITPVKRIEKADTPADALAIVLNERGAPDAARMSQLLGKPEADILNELVADGVLFRDPDGGHRLAEEYLSGDVVAKLARAEEAAETDGAFTRNVEALKAVQPQPLKASEISIRLGAPWVPEADVNDFVQQTLEGSKPPGYRYVPAVGLWAREERQYRWNVQAALNVGTYGTKEMDAVEIIDRLLNGKDVVVRVPDPNDRDRTIVDQEETQKAQAKARDVRSAWTRWLRANPERLAALVDLYNDRFNREVPRAYDGRHLTFPGMAQAKPPREHQRNVVWRVIQQGTVLMAHEVGAGKTIAMAASAMELRRLGLSRKNLFVVPNHLVGQFAQEFLSAYPSANVLVPRPVDFQAKNRQELMARIATGDYDAIVVAQSQFTLLPISPERQQAMIQAELNELEAALREEEAARDYSRTQSQSEKELVKAKKRLESRLKDMQGKIAARQDDVLTFEDLGVDALFVDEADLYKNLQFVTRKTRVKGLPNAKSQRAFDMHAKTSIIREGHGGRGVVFATGTPVSNTIAELWTMLRYLAPQTLDQLGIQRFDAWADTFGDTITQGEMTVTGKFQMVTRFAQFQNAAELNKLFQTVADIVTEDDMPELAKYKPKLRGGERIDVTIPPTAELQAYMKAIEARANNLKNVDPTEDNMLKISSDARKAALDVQLVNPRAPEQSGGKVDRAAEKIAEVWKREARKRGTQIVFLDMGTPKALSDEEIAKLEKAEADSLRAAASAGEDAEGIAEEEEVELGGLTAEEQKLVSDVYNRIKAKLIARGIPADQIAFIHDAKTKAQKQKLFDAVNDGTVRVILGSTEKLGAGTNVQQRLAALHHIDAPWRPRDVEQREGRILRQGNQVYGPTFKDGEVASEGSGVEIYRYLTEGSFDSVMWSGILAKARAIKSMVKRVVTARTIEDADEFVLSAAQAAALATGNPDIVRYTEMKAELGELEGGFAAHQDAAVEYERLLARTPAEIAALEAEIAALTKARAEIEREAAKGFAVTIRGRRYEARDADTFDAMQYALNEAWGRKDWTPIATLYGSELQARMGWGQMLERRLVRPDGKVLGEWRGRYNDISGRGQLQAIEAASRASNFEGRIKLDRQMISRKRSTMESAERQKAQAGPFEQLRQLERLRADVPLIEMKVTAPPPDRADFDRRAMAEAQESGAAPDFAEAQRAFEEAEARWRKPFVGISDEALDRLMLDKYGFTGRDGDLAAVTPTVEDEDELPPVVRPRTYTDPLSGDVFGPGEPVAYQDAEDATGRVRDGEVVEVVDDEHIVIRLEGEREDLTVHPDRLVARGKGRGAGLPEYARPTEGERAEVARQDAEVAERPPHAGYLPEDEDAEEELPAGDIPPVSEPEVREPEPPTREEQIVQAIDSLKAAILGPEMPQSETRQEPAEADAIPPADEAPDVDVQPAAAAPVAEPAARPARKPRAPRVPKPAPEATVEPPAGPAPTTEPAAVAEPDEPRALVPMPGRFLFGPGPRRMGEPIEGEVIPPEPEAEAAPEPEPAPSDPNVIEGTVVGGSSRPTGSRRQRGTPPPPTGGTPPPPPPPTVSDNPGAERPEDSGDAANASLGRQYARSMKGESKRLTPGMLEAMRRAYVRAMTDDRIDLNMLVEEIEKEHGPLPPEFRVDLLVRMSPGLAAKVNIDRHLKPHLQGLSESDLAWLDVFLTHQDNLDVARAMGLKAEQESLDNAGPFRGKSWRKLVEERQRLRAFEPGGIAENAQKAAASAKRVRQLEKQVQRDEVRHQQKVMARAARRRSRVESERLFSEGLTVADSHRALGAMARELGARRLEKIRRAAEGVWAFNRMLLDAKVENDVISRELYDELVARYPHYVPTRIVDFIKDPENGGPAVGKSLSLNDTGLRRNTLEGTTRRRENPLASTYRNAIETERIVKQNQVALAMKLLIEADPDGLGQEFREAPEGYTLRDGEGYVAGFDQGERFRYVTGEPMSKALKVMAASPVHGFFRAFMHFWKELITRFPLFIAYQVPQDAASYTLREMSRSTGNPLALPGIIADLVVGYAVAFRGILSGEYKGSAADYLKSGGGMAGFNMKDIDTAREKVYELNGRTSLARLVRQGVLFDWSQAIGQRVELAPRVASYRRAKRKGKSEVESTIAGRDVTLDFLRGGYFARYLNQLLGFFNVGAQASASIPRMWRENPLGFALMSSMVLGSAVLLEAAIAGDDEDEWEDLPKYLKDRGLLFPTGGTSTTEEGEARPRFIMLPVRELAPLLIVGREAVRRFQGKEGREPLDLLLSTAMAASPIQANSAADMFGGFFPEIIATPAQLAMDYDWFRGGPIKTKRNDEQASNLAKWTANALQFIGDRNETLRGLGSVSPSQVEFTARGFGGHFARTVGAASDIGRERGAQDRGPIDTPLVGGLINRFVTDAGGERLRTAQQEKNLIALDVRRQLREAKVGVSIGTVQGTIQGVPLRRSEQARYQELANRETDRELRALLRSGEIRRTRGAERAKLVQQAIARGRQTARERIMERITPSEQERRKRATEKKAS